MNHDSTSEAVGRTLRPESATIHFANDPLAVRHFLREGGFDIAEFQAITSGDGGAVLRFARHHGWPVCLRSTRGAQRRCDVRVVRPCTDLDQIWAKTAEEQWLVDAYEPLALELTVTIAQRPSGHRVVYPVYATDRSYRQPRQMSAEADPINDRATAIANSIVEGIDATGILTVKLLATRDGRLLVDDFAHGPYDVEETGVSGGEDPLRCA